MVAGRDHLQVVATNVAHYSWFFLFDRSGDFLITQAALLLKTVWGFFGVGYCCSTRKTKC